MQSLTTLEYGKMLALVARYAHTPMGRGYLENLQPLTNRLALERDLRALGEALALAQRDVVAVFRNARPGKRACRIAD